MSDGNPDQETTMTTTYPTLRDAYDAMIAAGYRPLSSLRSDNYGDMPWWSTSSAPYSERHARVEASDRNGPYIVARDYDHLHVVTPRGVCYSCTEGPHWPRVRDLLDEVSDLDTGDGNLRTVVEQALRDDPAATAADVRAIWQQATEDAVIERERA